MIINFSNSIFTNEGTLQIASCCGNYHYALGIRAENRDKEVFSIVSEVAARKSRELMQKRLCELKNQFDAGNVVYSAFVDYRNELDGLILFLDGLDRRNQKSIKQVKDAAELEEILQSILVMLKKYAPKEGASNSSQYYAVAEQIKKTLLPDNMATICEYAYGLNEQTLL
jgi:hypothetical protein